MTKVCFWKRALRLVFDLLFPINCLGCGREGVWLCPDCLGKIPAYPKTLAKEISLSGIGQVLIAADYENKLIQKSVHLLKYKSVADLAKPLAKLAAPQLPPQLNTIIIPVPLHPRRQRERGFNQSALIAKEIATAKNLLWDDTVLQRTRHTTPQMKLDRAARLKNLTGAFTLTNPQKIRSKHIVLIDDVLTTGKTLVECATTLRRGKPADITALVIAHGK